MDDTLLFIPPCCVDKKLPKALLHAPNRTLNFYTHGDVTMEKFYRAVSYLLDGPHVMVVTMAVISIENVVFFEQCLERGWVSHLIITSGSKSQQLIHKRLSPYADRVLYVEHRDADSDAASHMVLYTPYRMLSLTGPMFNRVRETGLTAYTLQFFPSMALFSDKVDWGNPLRNALFPDVLRFRQQIKKHEGLASEFAHFLRMDFPPYPELDE